MDEERTNFRKLFGDIQLHLDVGLEHYKARRSANDATLYGLFVELDGYLKETQKHQEYLSAGTSKYDFVDAKGVAVKANGYRSLLYVMFRLLELVLQSIQKTAKKDGANFMLMFQSTEHIKALSLHSSALHCIERLAFYCHQLMAATPAPQLFNTGEAANLVKRKSIMEHIYRDLFYGHFLGFQYPSNMKQVLKIIGVGMASYEKWYHGGKFLSSLWKGSQYLQKPSRLGVKLDYLTVETSVQFVKAFWSIPEQPALQGFIKLTSTHQSAEVYKWLEIPAMPLKVLTIGGEVDMPPPSVYIGCKSLPLLLISHKQRGSQPSNGYTSRRNHYPPSPGLVVHFHGGGYVSQTPTSHSAYLRQWAFELEVPVVSLHYSLSPEAPYPRALDECVFCYSWILQNLAILGSTGKKIVFAGDSAGGNFCITTCMKLKQLGIRLPDAILIIYPSTNLCGSVCPSRIMSIIDPILPLGVLLACQQAYTNRMSTPEQLSTRRDYRARLMRAQGFYSLQDTASKGISTKLKRKFSWSRHKSTSSDDESEKASSPKVSPLCPPIPNSSIDMANLKDGSSTSQQQSIITEEEQSIITKESDDGPFHDLPLDVGSSEASAVTVYEDDYDVLVCKREPDDKDKLTPAETEELLAEVMKGLDGGVCAEDPFMSPLLASNELLAGLPPVHIVGAALDSLLDDSVSMAQKLKLANQPVTLDVINNMPHGFLAIFFTGNTTDHKNATKLCLDYLKEELDIHKE